MYELFLWLVVIFGYSLCIYILTKIFIYSKTLYREAPYVPVSNRVLLRALEELDLQEGDRFIDIGSGDGKVVFKASRLSKGAITATGVEAEGALVLGCKIKRYLQPYPNTINFIKQDAFKHKYSGYNKVFLYLTTDLTSQLVEMLKKELPKGSKVVSVDFSFGDDFLRKNNTKTIKLGRHRIYKWQK